MTDNVLEVISWDPEDNPYVPGLAHGITRYGGHWFDVGLSVVPGEVDALEALERCSQSYVRFLSARNLTSNTSAWT
jgi:hypothetical protein